MSIRKMKIQQGYIVYQIPAEEIVKLREADCFLNYIDEMIEMDEKAGKYLKYKLVDELTDEEIALKLGVSRRALYGIKPNAYFRIAIWSHQVAYIKENTYEFIFNYAGLYERLK